VWQLAAARGWLEVAGSRQELQCLEAAGSMEGVQWVEGAGNRHKVQKVEAAGSSELSGHAEEA
jgi:hypothetical protein